MKRSKITILLAIVLGMTFHSCLDLEPQDQLGGKNLTLGYTLPASWLAKTNAISKLRIYFTGADLWEHSKLRDGWDPEASRKTKDLGRYPFNRTFTVGVNATF